MSPTIVYITGFRQHAGKTVTSIGLISCLRKIMDPSRIAYIKPVGQDFITLPDGTHVDKDVDVLQSFAQIPDMDARCISPVQLSSGLIQKYLAEPDHRLQQTRKLEDSIIGCLNMLSKKDVIIAEGSGHPGVGGILGLSNGDVATLINANMVFLSGGGLGRALDMLEVDLSYFLYKRSKVRGIIFNKVIPDKISMMQRLITEDLLNSKFGAYSGTLRILGFLPEIQDLARPSMRTIVEKYKGSHTLGEMNTEAWEAPARHTRVISMDSETFKVGNYLHAGDVVFLAASSRRRAGMILQAYSRKTRSIPISGLVLTCGNTETVNPEIRNEIVRTGLPTIIVQEDTAEAERKMTDIFENTKLQNYDIKKIKQIEDMFAEHFEMEKFLEIFKIGK